MAIPCAPISEHFATKAGFGTPRSLVDSTRTDAKSTAFPVCFFEIRTNHPRSLHSATPCSTPGTCTRIGGRGVVRELLLRLIGSEQTYPKRQPSETKQLRLQQKDLLQDCIERRPWQTEVSVSVASTSRPAGGSHE